MHELFDDEYNLKPRLPLRSFVHAHKFKALHLAGRQAGRTTYDGGTHYWNQVARLIRIFLSFLMRYTTNDLFLIIQHEKKTVLHHPVNSILNTVSVELNSFSFWSNTEKTEYNTYNGIWCSSICYLLGLSCLVHQSLLFGTAPRPTWRVAANCAWLMNACWITLAGWSSSCARVLNDMQAEPSTWRIYANCCLRPA